MASSSLRADISLSARHTPAPASSSVSASPTPPPPPPPPPTNSQIEAAIQKAQQMSARSTPDGRDTRMQLFVGNLPYRVRWQDLKDLFRKAGTVLRADVSLGPDNRSRGYGTVLFGNPDDAAHAVEMFNGYSWQSRTLEVRPDRLPPDFDAGLTAPYPQLGPSPLHAMPYIPPPPLKQLDGGMLDDPLSMPVPSPMGSVFDRPRVPSASGRTLFVGNLPFHCQWQDLKDLFRQAGSVLRADVVLGPDGRSRGHGTVSFSNDSDAEHAVRMFNGYEFNGRPLKVHFDKYTGQNTPAGGLGSSASPAPQMQSLPSYVYPALPAYLTHAPPPLVLPAGYEHIPSPLHSPMDLYPPSMPHPHPHPHPGHGPPSPSPLLPTSNSLNGTNSNSPPSLHIETQIQTQQQQQQQQAGTTSQSQHHLQSHPAHPGPITLPPPPHGFPAPLSPQSVPPITPSMPSFSFVPQAPTPPLHPQFLSPGIGPFSPTLSPGGFFSGVSVNPYLNPAPGAPVLMVPHSPVGVSGHPPGSPGSWYMHYGAEPSGYFPPVHSVHPLAQEVSQGSSNESGSTNASADDAATVAGGYRDHAESLSQSLSRNGNYGQNYNQNQNGDADRPRASFVEESVLRRPLPASDPSTRDVTPASSSGSALATSDEASSRSVSRTGASSSAFGSAQQLYMALPHPRSASTGQGQSFSQVVRAAPAPIERPQPGHAHSSSVSVAHLENGLAQLDLGGGAGGGGASGRDRDRRASWHVDSPSVEFGAAGSGGYFALGR